MNKSSRLLLLGIVCCISLVAKADPPNPCGIDSIDTYYYAGFDFVKRDTCDGNFANESYKPCWNHMVLGDDGTGCPLDLPIECCNLNCVSGSDGYSIDMGKMNLDSIKSAPSDSVFHMNKKDRVTYIYPSVA